MFYDAAVNDHGLPHDPLKALVGPRPIGWITAMNARGELNLSPYSFFNAVGERPFVVAFSSSGYKDAVAFIDETREFVCNLATFDLREEMNRSSAPLPRGSSEIEYISTSRPSRSPRRFCTRAKLTIVPPQISGHWVYITVSTLTRLPRMMLS